MTMTPMTASGFCKLFCCPPLPSKIAAKLAFMPPKQSYSIIPDDSCTSKYSFEPHESADWQFGAAELELLTPCFARTRRANRIACLHVRCPDVNVSRYTLLFSHGNAVDLGQMSSFLLSLSRWLGCNIFCYDYSGYGCSSGKPSEKNLYADIEAAFKMLQSKYDLKPDKIILYGQSIGTVPTVDLASRQRCAAVVLHSALTSGMRVAFPATKRTYCFDAFPNIDKVTKIRSPVLVIHGTDDEVIDFTHGLAIYEKCPVTVEPLWVEGAGHNDVEIYSQYIERLRRFIHEEVPQRFSSISDNNSNNGGGNGNNGSSASRAGVITSVPGPSSSAAGGIVGADSVTVVLGNNKNGTAASRSLSPVGSGAGNNSLSSAQASQQRGTRIQRAPSDGADSLNGVNGVEDSGSEAALDISR